MATDYEFQGWLGHSPESVEGKMEWGTFEPKKWAEDDVDIQITHCGICGSDLHMLRSGWSPTPYRKFYSTSNKYLEPKLIIYELAVSVTRSLARQFASVVT